jgi:O-acetyl-ADP-ribose deacetylase
MNQVIRQHEFSSGQLFQLVRGDLTEEEVDAIVNAANEDLLHGGGVAWAIVRKGGQKIQDESTRWVSKHGSVSHAEPAVTGAGSLPCRYVIHAVGPIWGDGDEDAKLKAAVAGSLTRAKVLELRSLAMTAISTGIFGFPKDRAAGITYKTVSGWFEDNPESDLRQVRLVIIDKKTLAVFEQTWDSYFPAET